MSENTDDEKKEKKTARRFGLLKQPKKVSAKLSDLEASAAAGEAVRGGLILEKGKLGPLAGRIDNDAHGCPACPHPG